MFCCGYMYVAMYVTMYVIVCMYIVGVNREGNLCEISEDGDISFDTDHHPTLMGFIEEYRNKLLSSSCEYMEDLGVMEIATK